MASKAVTMDNINPNMVKLEYAVRGPLVIRATEIEKELEKVIIFLVYILHTTFYYTYYVKQNLYESVYSNIAKLYINLFIFKYKNKHLTIKHSLFNL